MYGWVLTESAIAGKDEAEVFFPRAARLPHRETAALMGRPATRSPTLANRPGIAPGGTRKVGRPVTRSSLPPLNPQPHPAVMASTPSPTPSETPPVEQADDLADAARLERSFAAVREQLGRVVVGQSEVIEQLLIAILARGHCLLEGVPGLAKTLMIRSLAETMHLEFRRIQFTPDLMPGDITGTDIIQENPQTGRREMLFQPGPVFTQVLLADEINRTPPKTQAALLEAMQEHEVTAAGKTYRLQEPFFVLATQNPIEQEGTYPLPEAQRDRFLFHVVVGYPDREEEGEIIDRTTGSGSAKVTRVIDGDEIIAYQRVVRSVPLPENVKQFVLGLVRMLRPRDENSPDWVKQYIEYGPGPRASQQLVIGGKARALLHRRNHVSIADIEALALPALRHRLVPTFSADAEGLDTDDLIRRALTESPRPTAPTL